MRKVRLEKETLENVGRSVLAAGALREAEIEKIAAREELFAGVLARVNSADTAGARETFSFTRFVRRHELGLSGAMAAVLCVGVLGLYLQQKPSDKTSLKGIDIPAVRPEPARPGITPQVNDVDGFTAGRAQHPSQPDEIVNKQNEDAAPPAAEKAVYRQSRPSASARPQRTAAGSEPIPAEFYPVTYTGDNGESARGGRVIRVDVARSTLFAMGINVPLENESPTVKADLLIGPDGVTRAIRLVE